MRHWGLMAALALGATVGFACADAETAPLNEEVRQVCESFCDRAIECDDDFVVGGGRTDCMQECFGKADECNDVDELDMGLDQLRACAEDCDGLTACSIEADFECLL